MANAVLMASRSITAWLVQNSASTFAVILRPPCRDRRGSRGCRLLGDDDNLL